MSGRIAAFVFAVTCAWSQPAPQFSDYLVKEIFKGTPAAPQLLTAEGRRYRSRIREGVTKGGDYAFDGGGQPGPNFAGHYIVVRWGCGSPCTMMAIVDAITGKIYDPPMGNGFQMSGLGGGPWLPDTRFRLDSRLMIMTPCPNMGPVWTHYFLWQDNRWALVRKIPLNSR